MIVAHVPHLEALRKWAAAAPVGAGGQVGIREEDAGAGGPVVLHRHAGRVSIAKLGAGGRVPHSGAGVAGGGGAEERAAAAGPDPDQLSRRGGQHQPGDHGHNDDMHGYRAGRGHRQIKK